MKADTTYRAKKRTTFNYQPLQPMGLAAEYSMKSGSGAADDPWLRSVPICNGGSVHWFVRGMVDRLQVVGKRLLVLVRHVLQRVAYHTLPWMQWPITPTSIRCG